MAMACEDQRREGKRYRWEELSEARAAGRSSLPAAHSLRFFMAHPNSILQDSERRRSLVAAGVAWRNQGYHTRQWVVAYHIPYHHHHHHKHTRTRVAAPSSL